MRRETASARVRPRRRHGVRRLRIEIIEFESKILPSGILVTGSGPNQPAVVNVYDQSTGALINTFQPFPTGFRGAVVALGQSQGGAKIFAVGSLGGRPVADVLDAATGSVLATFPAASPAYRGSVSVSAGDINDDGNSDLVVSYGQGQPWVSVYSGVDGSPLGSFLAYGANQRGGVRTAVGDFNGDGQNDIAAVNAAGIPVVKIFDPSTFSTVADYKASFYAPRGGASISAGNLLGDGTTDLVIAQASPRGSAPGAEVAVFSGTSSAPLSSFTVAGPSYAQGVQVAAIDATASGEDQIALAPALGGSVTVWDSVGNSVATIGQIAPGASLAATSSLNGGIPLGGGIGAPTPSALTPLQRLGLYIPATGQFVPVTADDSALAGKDVYVIVHGLAPGYNTWVQNAEALGQTLLWWDTFPTQLPTSTDPGYNVAISGGLPPDSDFLLDGTTADGVVVSPTGLAQTLSTFDPNAAVLAYSWIDESASAVSWVGGVPEGASLPEAMTELNGERLATGLSQALGTDFTGKLQLIGHSFGSKVVTVAAGALNQDNAANIHVNQLTLLDSPEASNTVLGQGLAAAGTANYNWYFLQDVNDNRSDPSGTFVDNYISFLDEPFSTINYGPSNLGNVVDVELKPLVYSFDDPGDKHSYAAQWYAGSTWPTINGGNKVGQLWSPLVAGNSGPTNPPASLASSYSQTWTSDQQSTQFNLAQSSPGHSNPVLTPITFNSTSSQPGAAATAGSFGASVTLMQTGGKSTSSADTFTTVGSVFHNNGIRGITFGYDFTDFQPGDVLTITIDDTIGTVYTVFVMDASDMLSPTGLGTVSIADPDGDVDHTLTFTLTSANPNSTSSVKITNLQQLSY